MSAIPGHDYMAVIEDALDYANNAEAHNINGNSAAVQRDLQNIREALEAVIAELRS